MHHTLLAVHPDVRLQAEVPLSALAGLMHLRVAFAALVLRRRRRVDNRRIDDRAGRDMDALAVQMMVHRIQHLPAQLVLLQQMTEAADGRLARCRRNPRSTPTKRRSTADSYNASSTP